jgi:hypothetical protein
MPIPTDRILRTAATASLLPGALLLLMGFGVWWAFTPTATVRMIVMLLAAGFGGLLFWQALAVWTTVLAPRPIPFDTTFGNKLSPAANALFVAAMVALFGLPLALERLGIEAVLGGWWIAPLGCGAAVALLVMTLRAGARVLVSRRERMLAELEGD